MGKKENTPKSNTSKLSTPASALRAPQRTRVPSHVTKGWTHLWNAANILQTTSPAVSAHLSHRLHREARGEITAAAQTLLCDACGALTWTAATRVRRRKTPVRGRRNCVLRRCAACRKVAVHAGSFVDKASSSSSTAVAVVPGRGAGDGVPGLQATEGTKKRKRRISKSGLRRRLSYDSAISQGRSPGLAASFLFEDVEE